ncbi:MAG: PAS domain S-box protein [Pirellulaceae bacterium]
MNKQTTDVPLVVGVGASAGGLEAFTDLLKALGDEPGLAIVFVQHRNATTKSLLAKLLGGSTAMEIIEVSARTKVQANTVYLCPPKKLLTLGKGSLNVQDDASKERQPTSIDHFFHSIAEDQGERGLGVILSGAGSDGTLGLKAINDCGGMTFSQDSQSAKYDSMPRNAATTGVADHVMPPAGIAAELLKYADYLTTAQVQLQGKLLAQSIENAIPDIAETLLQATGHNFQHYKLSTLGRRIQRRMQVLKIPHVDDYLKLLKRDSDETQNLFRELLISVTAFFRDPESFERLTEEVLPKLFQNRNADDPVRIWVAGCATGEEAYTIAILCREFLDRSHELPACGYGDATYQIFASDIDERALSIARQAAYPVGITENVSEDRLGNFFIKKGNRYHIKKEIRETVLFSPHNLISDPPFSRLDLLSCRNLLIYLGPHLQKKLIPLFHYALRPNGYLFLGPSESISTHGELFRSVDAKHRISQRKGTAIARSAPLAIQTPTGGLVRPPGSSPLDDDKTDVVQVMQRIILDEFAPKSVVVDEEGQVICSSGETNKYLSTGEGAYQNNIVKMARRGLRIGLRAALLEAKTKRRRVTHENVSVQTADGKQRVMLTVQPMMRLGEDTGLFIVVFHDVGLPLDLSINPPGVEDQLAEDGKIDRQTELMIEQLERELATTRDDLDNTMQEMETANEELKSSNEELLSMNEELQSANEELETSKEEIRSGSDAIARANTDLENLLRSTRIATIFMDDDFVIRSFTSAATEIYGLIPTDIGRPLTQIVPNVDEMPPLPRTESLSVDSPIEHTIVAHDGRSYIRRVLPYQSPGGGNDGIVVTFNDVTDLAVSKNQLAQRESRLASLISSTAEGIYGIDLDGICTFANKACANLLGYDDPDELLGRQMHELIHSRRNDGSPYPNQECHIYKAYRDGTKIHVDDEVFWRADDTSFPAEYWSYPQVLDGKTVGCVVTFLDITERKRAETELADAKTRLEISLQVSDVAPWSWDIQTNAPVANPMLNKLFGFDENACPALDEFLERIDESAREKVSAAIERSTKNGDVYDEEYPVCWPNGEQRHVRARGRVRTNCHGEIEDFFGVVVDITERKMRELDIAEREAHLRRVIDNQLGFVGVLDTDGTLLEANATALLAAGLNRDDVIGKKFWDCYWWNYDDVVSKRLENSIQQALNGEDVRYDEVICVAGGERTSIDFMIRPVRDADGEITHLIPSGVDISERKRAENEVLNREQRLQLALDSGGMGLWEWDIATDHITWSDQMFAMFGYTPEDFDPSKAGFLKVVHPDDRPMLQKMIQSAFTGTCQTHEVDFRVIRGTDKSDVWTLSRGSIYRDPDGKPLSIVSVAVDVTQRKQWETDLIDREAHLRRVINNQLGLVGVIDRSGILLEVDERSLEIARTRREDVIGKPFADAPWWNYNPAVAQQMRDAMQRAYEGEVVRYDVSLFASGSEGVMIDFMISPVFDADGNVEYLIPSGVDIRERVKIEKEQRSVTRRMRMALRAGRMAAWEWTPAKSIWTPELYELLGIDSDQEANSDLFFSLVHPEDVEPLKKSWQRAIEGTDTYDSEFRIIRPDGQIRWTNGLGEVVRDKAGKVVRMHGVNWDSTKDHLQAEALRVSERRALAANASKSEFLANMSHEIRTPMTAILGYTDLVAEMVDNSEALSHLRTIRRNGDFLLDIINDILDLSKIEAGKLDISEERFSPQRLVEDVRSIMEVRAKEDNLTLDVEYRGKIPTVIQSDAKRLRQILINLVGNAIKFTKEGSVKIIVQCEPKQRQMNFSIVDTGIGMSEAQQKNLFQPFSQGDGNVNREFGGTGLGLAISKRLTEMLDGKIDLQSKLGEGSTFIVTIGTGDLDHVDMIEQSPDAAARQTGSTKDAIQLCCHVLVVDDRRDIRFLSKRFLTAAGASVEEAEDGELAVAAVTSALEVGKDIDLILLDMQMPKLDGYETAKSLRRLGYSGPIIALTADAMQGDMNRCIESGCNDYLSKPIDKQVLLQKVKQYVNPQPQAGS